MHSHALHETSIRQGGHTLDPTAFPPTSEPVRPFQPQVDAQEVPVILPPSIEAPRESKLRRIGSAVGKFVSRRFVRQSSSRPDTSDAPRIGLFDGLPDRSTLPSGKELGARGHDPSKIERDKTGLRDFFDRALDPTNVQAVRIATHDILRELPRSTLKERLRVLDAERVALLQRSGDSQKLAVINRDIQQLNLNLDKREKADARYSFMERSPKSIAVSVGSEIAKDTTEWLNRTPRLSQQAFIAKHYLSDEAEGVISIAPDSDGEDVSIALPTANFVYAEGFKSWSEGREGEKQSDLTDARTSVEIMKEYGAKDTPIPPVDAVSAYVQPNGIVFFATEQGSHRTGAAIARGGSVIYVKALKVHRVPHNIFALDQTEPTK